MKKIPIYLYTLFVLLSAIWGSLFIWVHQPAGLVCSILLIGVWWFAAGFVLYTMYRQLEFRHYMSYGYTASFVAVLVLYFSLTPQNNRQWKPEVAKIINFRFVDGKVEIHNLRNFLWHSQKQYTTQWETRRYALEDLDQVDLIVSHFIPGPVAHAFISFGFKNGEHLAFSIEVRQEQHETFSILGGFFRQYELAMVVGDENDLIYTRSNIRDEDVYIYPIQMNQTEIQMLFLEYLNTANRLNNHPRWYNTLLSNCTTILFDLSEHAMGTIPRDYRVVLPGLLPQYLYDYRQLDSKYSLQQWQDKAHVNPKTKDLKYGPDDLAQPFSELIRQDLPRSTQTPSHATGRMIH